MNRYTIRGVDLTQGLPKLCVPLMPAGAAAVPALCAALKDCPFDLVEWRVDALGDLGEWEETLAALRRALPDAPLLATVRTEKEGGQAALSDRDYFALLRRLVRSRAVDAVDIEYFHEEALRGETVREAREAGLPVVMSSHDFQRTPPEDEMAARLTAMQNGGCIAKLAVMPRRPEDVLALLAATLRVRAAHPGRPVITMSMGALGAVSRLAGETFGSALTFGTAGEASAPGQLDARLLAAVLRALYGGR